MEEEIEDDGYLSPGARARVRANEALMRRTRRRRGGTNANAHDAFDASTRDVRLLTRRRERHGMREGDERAGDADAARGTDTRVRRGRDVARDEYARALAKTETRREASERALVEEKRRGEEARERYERDVRALGERARRMEEEIEKMRRDAAARDEAAARKGEEAREREEAREMETRGRLEASETALIRVRRALETSEREREEMKRLSAEANARGDEQEARVFRAVKTAERLKRRAEEAEIRAKNAESALVVNRESDAMHNCALVERASRRVTDERAKSEDLEKRLAQTTEMLEDLRAKMAPNMERARLEGAQAYKVRVETLSSHQEDLKREVEARDAVVESLRGELGKADARFNELKRGAEFKIKSLEDRFADVERRLAQKEAHVKALTIERDRETTARAKQTEILEQSCSKDFAIASLLQRLEAHVCELHARADKAAKMLRTQRKGDATKMAALRARAQAARRARDAAKAHASALVRENEDSLLRIGVMEVQLKDAERMIENANCEWLDECRRRETAESAAAQAEAELSDAHAKINSLESEHSSIERENAQSFATALERNMHAEVQISEMNERMEALRLELSAASEALVGTREEVSTATTREQTLRWRTQELECQNNTLRRTLEEQRASVSEYDDVEADLAKREEELAAAEARAARLDCELTDAKIEARRAKERMVKMRIEMDELRPEQTSTVADGDVVAAVREELSTETTETKTVVQGALALSPDQVLLPQTPEESEPARARALPAANPFAAGAETGKENVVAPKGTKRSAHPRARVIPPPLSPLSLLNIR